MSAFIVSDDHLRVLVTAMQDWAVTIKADDGSWDRVAPHGRINPDDVMAELAAENAASVAFRYAHIPEQVEECAVMVASPPEFKRRPASLAQVAKAIHCYQYQSCEHEGWHNSHARRSIDKLAQEVMRRIPGYDDAEWSI